ncbi:hypothetical protein BC834DRAFT_901365 [Gloeopeniophorella convolvens]|nr:hypothetical protein BC834DRAFT_901365 [Gloeopeniophorella convolvens]
MMLHEVVVALLRNRASSRTSRSGPGLGPAQSPSHSARGRHQGPQVSILTQRIITSLPTGAEKAKRIGGHRLVHL